ncbi:MAG TPA: universal stress protein, partial [Desulfosporosinus sp.]|nr:universal stress protein [Desulfosporosinus sp.]
MRKTSFLTREIYGIKEWLPRLEPVALIKRNGGTAFPDEWLSLTGIALPPHRYMQYFLSIFVFVRFYSEKIIISDMLKNHVRVSMMKRKWIIMEVSYKKILVPVDGSKNSFVSLKHAVRMARSFDGEISILYVSALSQQVPSYEQVKGHKIAADSSTDPANFAKTIITEALKHVPEGIRVQTYNEIGEPRIVITEFAQKNKYDMIVIGSRGLGTIERLLIGSVSSYVVKHATCPVL